MSLSASPAKGRRTYRCEACGLIEPWGPEWIWYGALLDDQDAVPTFCSLGCAEAWRKRHRKPPVVVLDP